MTNLLKHAARYPIAIGVVIGMLISGLAYRLTDDTPSGPSAATSTDGSGAGFGASQPGGTEEGVISGPASQASASTTPSGDPLEPGAAPPGGSGTALTASDVGVNATTIKVGVALEDLGALLVLSGTGTLAGPTSVDDQRTTWQSLIDDVNRNGGVGGRKIEPYYYRIDTTRSSDQRAACNEWTETHRVFAVFAMGALSSFGGSGTLCVAVEHRTLTIEDTPQTPGSYYAEAGGMLINGIANATRALADAAYAYEHYGKLRGHKLGLIVDQDPGETMAKQGLIPALHKMGYSLTYTAVVPSDPSRGPAQTTPHVAQMRAAGVDTVIVATNFINMTSFVTTAERQGWRPQYLASSYNGNDVAQLNTGMPESFDGATVISYQSYKVSAAHPEEPVTRRCREHYNKVTGSSYKPGELDSVSLRFIVAPCTDLELFVTAATPAGPGLTRSKVSAAVQSSTFAMRGLGGSWGKPDYNDVVRPLVWGRPDGSSDNCTPNEQRCWNDAGAPWNPRGPSGRDRLNGPTHGLHRGTGVHGGYGPRAGGDPGDCQCAPAARRGAREGGA